MPVIAEFGLPSFVDASSMHLAFGRSSYAPFIRMILILTMF
jgi:hypothetical protein